MNILSKKPIRSLILVVAMAFGAGVSAPRSASAADGPARTVSVSGAGQAKGKPTVVELGGTIAGEAELASDATVKFRDAKRRATKAIEGLKIATLSVSTKGFAINQAADPNMQQMMFRGGQPAANAKQMVSVSEQVQLTLKDADKLSDEELMTTVLKIVDAARDAGLVLGGGGAKNYQQMIMMMQFGQAGAMGLATFKIPDAAALRSQAYQKAMDDAKAKATRLAEVSGAKLGKVVSVQEQAVATGGGEGNAMMSMFRMMMMDQMQKPETEELTSNAAGEISLSVTLSVQFALE